MYKFFLLLFLVINVYSADKNDSGDGDGDGDGWKYKYVDDDKSKKILSCRKPSKSCMKLKLNEKFKFNKNFEFNKIIEVKKVTDELKKKSASRWRELARRKAELKASKKLLKKEFEDPYLFEFHKFHFNNNGYWLNDLGSHVQDNRYSNGEEFLPSKIEKAIKKHGKLRFKPGWIDGTIFGTGDNIAEAVDNFISQYNSQYNNQNNSQNKRLPATTFLGYPLVETHPRIGALITLVNTPLVNTPQQGTGHSGTQQDHANYDIELSDFSSRAHDPLLVNKNDESLALLQERFQHVAVLDYRETLRQTIKAICCCCCFLFKKLMNK